MGAEPNLAALATITVSYNPEPALLAAQLAQLPAAALKVLVDNASGVSLRAQLRSLVAGRADVLLVENETNVGLAAAINQGVARAAAHRPGCAFVLLLDQDTEPGSGGAEALFAAWEPLRAAHPRLGAIGPRLLDVDTGLEHGFHQVAGWRWSRRFPVEEAALAVANINGSGLLMPMALFRELGGLREDFFIDHVDTEWSFRLLAAGRELYGLPGVRFRHRMGEKTIRFWMLGWRVWPYRSPARHFFLFRNTVRLLRTPGVPAVWKLWAPVKLAATLAAHLAFDAARWPQLTQMLRGLRAG
ncbi:MAG: glycosyltransferase family 2 protein, partial [Arenimonas sp.]